MFDDVTAAIITHYLFIIELLIAFMELFYVSYILLFYLTDGYKVTNRSEPEAVHYTN